MARSFFSRFGRQNKSRKALSRGARRRSRRAALHRVDLRVEPLEDRRLLASGDLDTMFDVDGILVSNLGFTERVEAVVIQSDGKIVVAGTVQLGASTNTNVFGVARYNSNGSIDTGFGNELVPANELDNVPGLATIDFDSSPLNIPSGTSRPHSGRDLLIDSTGRIVVMGQATDIVSLDLGFGLARLDSDGRLDSTFGVGGKVITVDGSLLTSDNGTAVAMQSDGTIVAAGRRTGGLSPDFLLARYNGSTGALIGSVVTTDFFGGTDGANDVAIQSDDKIVLAGIGTTAGLVGQFGVARYDASGTLDTTFGGTGKVLVDIVAGAAVTDEAQAVVMDGTNIVLAGTGQGATTIVAMARLLSNGSLDATFNDDGGLAGTTLAGTAAYNVPNGNGVASNIDSALGLTIQQDGKYVLGGFVVNTSGVIDRQVLVARFMSSGVRDTAFDSNGLDGTLDAFVITQVVVGLSDETAFDVVMQPDGKIVVAGRANASDILVARYESGQLTADADGPYVLDEPGGSVVLNGTAFGAGPITFTWDLDDDGIFGETGVAALYGDETGATPTFTVSGIDGPTVFDVTLRASNLTQTAEDTTTVTVLNVAPTAALANDGPADEGTSANVSFSGQFDPSAADTLAGFRYSYDFDNDGIWEVGDGSYGGSVASASAVVAAIYLADGPAIRVVKGRILDDDGGFTDYTTAITVNNVDPVVTADIATVTVDEGDTAANTGTVFDVPGDVVDLTASIGSVINNGDGTWSWSYLTTDGPDDSQLVTIFADDGDGGLSDVSFNLVVNNVDPVVTADDATVTVDEGDTAANTGTVFDVPGDVVGLTASIGSVINNGDGTWSWSYLTTDGPVESQLVTIFADDGEGGLSDVSFNLVVNNVDPTADAGGPYSVDEGSSVLLTATGSDVPGDPLTFEWDLDGDTQYDDGVGASVLFDASNLDGPDAVVVSVRVTDGDGGEAFDSATVNIDNVDPTADAGGPYLTFDDTPIVLGGSGSDVPGDPLTFTWDLDGDNVFGETGVGATRGDEVGASPTFDPTGLSTGSYTVTLRVTDGDGGLAEDTGTVNVLSEGTLLIDGVLYVVGTDQCDVVFIFRHNGNIKVYATFNDDNPVVVDADDVDEIQIRVRGGNDVVVVHHSVSHTTTIDGGSGCDLLSGGSGRDLILGGTGDDLLAGHGGDDVLMAGSGRDDLFGGSGNDVLVAGGSDDLLFGGSGRDLMIGGQDNDYLDGGSDDDVLIGGVTIHDNDVDALDAVMAVWTSSMSFADRVETLTEDGGLLEAGVAVFDDNDTDVLIGGSGRDLLFADVTFAGGDRDIVLFNHHYDYLVPVN